MALRIEDYALIGDCETAALVGKDGSIDWLCWPRFDSDACFASLIGKTENGRFRLSPKEKDVIVTRAYRPGTLILETRFECSRGAATIVDFMPLNTGNSHVVRIVKGERGEMQFCAELIFRFGYGTVVPWVVRIDDKTLRVVAGPDMVLVHTHVPLRGQDFTTIGEFTVKADDSVPFVLTYSPSHLDPPECLDLEDAIAKTHDFWTQWSDRARVDGPSSALVKRSLITLKTLTYRITGGIVAAPTTSLPEHIGGSRNWDYRFCWLRDATLTLLVLINAGYLDEAKAWRDWLLRAVAGSPDQMQVAYGLSGERRISEWELPWLDGYENSQPVRVGNQAHGQLQLDVYGELIDALFQASRMGLDDAAPGWALQLALLDHLEKIWRQPDSGIWETRSPPEHFTYSKVMVWVAFDRAIKSVEKFGCEGPLEKWKAIRADIHADICKYGYNESLNSFVRSYGSRHLDASLLLIPAVGFLPPEDPRVHSTIEAIENLLLRDGLVLRYDCDAVDDGLPAGDGAFLACSFWLVDAYVLIGRMDDARELFDRLVALCNDVGLLSEEYDPAGKRLLGNFPQAFSHLALVNAAFNLSKPDIPVKQRAKNPGPEE